MQKSLAALISFFTALTLSNAAQAGAWLQKADNFQAILSYDYLSTNKFFDLSGDKATGTKFSKGSINPYIEYGLTNDWTIGSALSLQSVSSNGVGGNVLDANEYKAAYTELFARTALFEGDDYIISIEPRLKVILNSDTGINPEGSAPIPELKFGYGQSYNFYDSFSDLGITYRKRTEANLVDMLKLEATAGTRPFTEAPILFITQAFYERRLSSDYSTNAGNYDLLKLQLSAAYEYDENITLQAGYFNNVYGINTAAGQGVLISTWLSF